VLLLLVQSPSLLSSVQWCHHRIQSSLVVIISNIIIAERVGVIPIIVFIVAIIFTILESS